MCCRSSLRLQSFATFSISCDFLKNLSKHAAWELGWDQSKAKGWDETAELNLHPSSSLWGLSDMWRMALSLCPPFSITHTELRLDTSNLDVLNRMMPRTIGMHWSGMEDARLFIWMPGLGPWGVYVYSCTSVSGIAKVTDLQSHRQKTFRKSKHSKTVFQKFKRPWQGLKPRTAKLQLASHIGSSCAWNVQLVPFGSGLAAHLESCMVHVKEPIW